MLKVTFVSLVLFSVKLIVNHPLPTHTRFTNLPLPTSKARPF